MMQNLKKQAGWSMVELLLAGFLALTMVMAAGYLFTNQVSGYQDIKNQAKMQADLKMALGSMTRQISNAGALLTNPLDQFKPGEKKITYAYIDLNGSYCDEMAKVLISFYSTLTNKQALLMEDIRCPSGLVQSRKLATLPPGGLDMSFRYLDKNNNATNNSVAIRSVQLDLEMLSAKAGKNPQKKQKQSIRVQLVNLK
jgi:hypothetical protein